jgi:hypothetical protein
MSRLAVLRLILSAALLCALAAACSSNGDGIPASSESDVEPEPTRQPLRGLPETESLSPTPLAEYLNELTALQDEVNQAWSDASIELVVAFDPNVSKDEQQDAMRAYVNRVASAIEDLTGDFEALEPPPEVAEAHDDYVGNLATFPNLLREILPIIDSAPFDEILGGIGLGAYDSFSAPCSDIKNIAAGHGIYVDLDWSNRPAC